MPRLRASRFPVPAGSTPAGISVPASSAHTTRTVPSPPATSTRSTASSIARRAIVTPASSSVVSSQQRILEPPLGQSLLDGTAELVAVGPSPGSRSRLPAWQNSPDFVRSGR